MMRNSAIMALVSGMRIVSVGMTTMMLTIGAMIVVVMRNMNMLVLMMGFVMMRGGCPRQRAHALGQSETMCACTGECH